MQRNLELLRDALAEIAGVVTCRIGLEANISPADYPMIRVVPVRTVPGRPYQNRTAELLLYFGAQIANSEGLEAVYAALFDLEADMLLALQRHGARYVETVHDEDRLDAYKLMAIRCELPVDGRVAATRDLACSYEVEAAT